MFDTLAGIIVGLLLVLPGFIIVDLAEARRAQRSDRSDWELVLRALIYACSRLHHNSSAGSTEAGDVADRHDDGSTVIRDAGFS
ncbi:MAG: hypothetical protein ABSH51_30235 [Solirubrobacteraceae bacterium]|jgi:hypothetical protein